ncbi:hypothetical protein [Flavobacterium macacae]|uniref:Uncharacterized protein n=1 Tax=Flavobacterium macacae TaxID=2488993 RepID=A0A3P3W4D6_9FLAO|nr:hypothetical protein [Flavobacterium macacae]RRJ87673.1 hypothetical protein EG849_15260 [Flavobacterium macacae]
MTEEIEGIKANIGSIQNDIKNKFKLPIFLTYSVILVIYNWDILFYLAFQKKDALEKIEYVKTNFFTENFDRVWKPILLAILYSILFPFIQLLINFVVQFFKHQNNQITRKEEMDNANHSYNIQQQLSGKQSLQQLQNKIDELIIEKEQLITTNDSLISQLKKDNSDLLDSNSIFKSEFEKTAKAFLKEVNELTNEEKSTVIELITQLQKKENSFTVADLGKMAIFPQHAQKTLNLLQKFKITTNSNSTGYFVVTKYGSNFIEYFKSNYVK